MMKNSSKILFLTILMMGTLITLSSTSWLGSWMGLEINLLAFIPLMATTHNMMNSESMMKYFLVQALGSSILLFAIIMHMTNFNIMHMSLKINIIETMMLSSLLLKSGTAPFHFWFPSVMENMSWMNSLTLMTWQKIAPLMLISYTFNKNMMLMAIIMSTIIGALGGLNQTSLRQLMAFSSISHLGWMLTAMMSNENTWLIYFLTYSFMSTILLSMFNSNKVYQFNQLFNMYNQSKTMKFMLFMNLLSLGGLPPFLGFLPKWIVIQELIFNNQTYLMFIMTMLTLITLFFYIRLTFTSFMLNYYENNWTLYTNNNSQKSKIYLFLSFLSMSSLPIVNLIMV